MKKLVLTSLLAFMTVSGASAATNYFVGGSAAMGFDSDHADVISIAPEFGWKVDSNWDLGVAASFGYAHKYIDENLVEDDAHAYGVDVFARYKVAQFGDVNLLLKGSVGADFLRFDGDTEEELGASIVPMITYDLSESFTLYANLNFLGAYAGYNFDDKDWGFGALVNADNVLNTSDFQIGFTYNF